MAKAKPTETATLLVPDQSAPGPAEQSQLEVIASPRTGKGTRVRGGQNASVEWARQRAAEALARRQNAQEAIVLQEVLPLWSDDHRGVPNPMIRSGLFGTKTSRNRQFLKGETIASLSNFDIVYKGEELLQDDLSVWMALMNMAARQRIGDVIFFSGYELVKDLGWSLNSDSYNRCKESISRLKANELRIQVKAGEAGYSGSLIREYAWSALTPDGDRKWMVRFEPRIAELFHEDTVTYLAWEGRRQIGPRATLALWLHSYFTSHREPLPISIQKIHELCKSDEKELRFFKRRVKVALERLVEIEFLTWYKIEGDTVHVKKAPVRFASLKAAVTKRLT